MTGKRRKSEKIRVNPCKSMRKIINEKNLWESLKSVGQTNVQREEKNSGEEKDPREEKQKSLRNLSKSEALH